MKAIARISIPALTLAIALSPALAGDAVSSFPSGTYSGTGTWKGKAGAAGDYTVETTVQDRTLVSKYNYKTPEGARAETHTMKLSREEPFFEVRDDKDKVVGRGYCFESECSYRIEAGPMTVEETFSFSGSTLHKFGSKRGANFEVVWKEVLKTK